MPDSRQPTGTLHFFAAIALILILIFGGLTAGADHSGRPWLTFFLGGSLVLAALGMRNNYPAQSIVTIVFLFALFSLVPVFLFSRAAGVSLIAAQTIEATAILLISRELARLILRPGRERPGYGYLLLIVSSLVAGLNLASLLAPRTPFHPLSWPAAAGFSLLTYFAATPWIVKRRPNPETWNPLAAVLALVFMIWALIETALTPVPLLAGLNAIALFFLLLFLVRASQKLPEAS